MRGAGIVVAIIVATAARVEAQDATTDTITIHIKAGDTLELLAAEYYGDRTRAVFIMTENHILHPRPLKAGERLRIPVSREITTNPKDSFKSLAAKFLGDERRASFLAEFNAMAKDDYLAGGTPLAIPFTVTHTAASTESLASIAAAYFGDTNNGEMLQRYNFLDKTAIDKGETIIVPVYNVRIIASKMPPLDDTSKQLRDRQRIAGERIAKALPVARQAWREGEFARVKALLFPLDHDNDPDYVDATTAVEIGVLLGASYVAFDDNASALTVFKSVCTRDPRYVLSTYDYSPKIVAVWNQACKKSG